MIVGDVFYTHGRILEGIGCRNFPVNVGVDFQMPHEVRAPSSGVQSTCPTPRRSLEWLFFFSPPFSGAHLAEV